MFNASLQLLTTQVAGLKSQPSHRRDGEMGLPVSEAGTQVESSPATDHLPSPERSGPQNAEEAPGRSAHTDGEFQEEGLTLEEIEDSLQSSFRWASVGFETLGCSQGQKDPLVQDAFDKCSVGLISVASKLIPRDRFAALLEEVLPRPAESKSSKPECTKTDDRVEQTISDITEFLVSPSELPKFSDLSNLTKVKRTLSEAVILPSLHPTLFRGVREPWKGVLLYGPPGTGKTALAKAVAGESGATFLLMSPSTLLSKFMGESEKLLSRVFQFAKREAPSIIFFDEIDAVCSSRTSSDDQGARRLLAEVLMQFNALRGDSRVTVLAATNRLQDLDPALLRRFERKIEVGLQDEEDRAKLLTFIMSKGTAVAPSVDFNIIARETEGYSGADLELLCREAAMYGVRDLMESENALQIKSVSVRPVTMEDFVLALTVIEPATSMAARSRSNRVAPLSPRKRRCMLAHELGSTDPLFNREMEHT